MNTLTAKTTDQVHARNVRFTTGTLHVQLDDGREISLPLAGVPWLKWLTKATPKQRANWSLEPGGYAIYWPDLDDGIEICHLLSPPPTDGVGRGQHFATWHETAPGGKRPQRLRSTGWGWDESRVTQAIGRVKRERQPALQRLKRRLEQICENNNGEAETSGNCAFRDCPFYGAEAAAKSRKSRKNREEHDGEPGRHPALAWPAQRILLDRELRGAEIDQQAVLDPTGTQVAQDWGHLLLLISSQLIFLLRLLRLFAAERLSPPVPSDGTRNRSGSGLAHRPPLGYTFLAYVSRCKQAQRGREFPQPTTAVGKRGVHARQRVPAALRANAAGEKGRVDRRSCLYGISSQH